MIFVAPMVAALVALALTLVLLKSKAAKSIQDVPNERSLHSEPIPRVGGVALMAGVLSGWVILVEFLAWWIVLPLMVLFIVSLVDDMRGLSVRSRLLAHLGAALLLVLASGLMAQNFTFGVVVLLLVVWMTNLYNFMDGSDGLAGGMTLFGFFVYGVAASLGNDPALAMLNFSVSASAVIFLYFNFYPAKVFMGDGGAIPLGFLSAAMGLWGWQRGLWPAWFPFLVFSPFVVDASVTLFKRALRGERVWQAHREHYYQRLVQMGLGHRNTALIEYALMVAVGISALWTLQNPVAWLCVLLAWGGIFLFAMLWLDHRWKARQLVGRA
ncbi:MAG: glycosyl transferase family 4 [Gallionellales bacterium GWA2_59_43]|nr:MAG: glycosyl transferase family 4 [Gallionellales bacterium GWA2_59_43]